jgi:hypothetical protein
MARPTPNFLILDGSFPDVGRVVIARLKAREAIESSLMVAPSGANYRRMVDRRARQFSRAHPQAAHLRQRRAGAHRYCGAFRSTSTISATSIRRHQERRRGQTRNTLLASWQCGLRSLVVRFLVRRIINNNHSPRAQQNCCPPSILRSRLAGPARLSASSQALKED